MRKKKRRSTKDLAPGTNQTSQSGKSSKGAENTKRELEKSTPGNSPKWRKGQWGMETRRIPIEAVFNISAQAKALVRMN